MKPVASWLDDILKGVSKFTRQIHLQTNINNLSFTRWVLQGWLLTCLFTCEFLAAKFYLLSFTWQILPDVLCTYQISAASCQLPVISCQLSAASYQLPVISCQLSAASYQLPVIICQLSAVSYQLPVISCQLSAASYQLPFISYQLSAARYQLPEVTFLYSLARGDHSYSAC